MGALFVAKHHSLFRMFVLYLCWTKVCSCGYSIFAYVPCEEGVNFGHLFKSVYGGWEHSWVLVNIARWHPTSEFGSCLVFAVLIVLELFQIVFWFAMWINHFSRSPWICTSKWSTFDVALFLVNIQLTRSDNITYMILVWSI